MDDDELSALIRDHASRHAASSRLRSAIRARIAVEAAARPPAELAPGPARTRRPWWTLLRSFGWGSGLAGFAAGTALTLLVLPQLPALTTLAGGPMDADLVADHVHSLAEGPLIEVASTDRHTVKPWFQGKLDYAPPVLNLADDGFPLTGGRIDHLRGQATAVLVFEHRKHVLNLFIWPASRVEAESRLQRRGFNIVHWSDGSMQYWAVSDMDAGEIEHFGQAWRDQRSHL